MVKFFDTIVVSEIFENFHFQNLQNLFAQKRTDRLRFSNSNARIASCCLVSTPDDPVSFPLIDPIVCSFSFEGFECNLKIHTSVHHPNGSPRNTDDDHVDVKFENESETTARRMEVWIKDQEEEIGMDEFCCSKHNHDPGNHF